MTFSVKGPNPFTISPKSSLDARRRVMRIDQTGFRITIAALIVAILCALILSLEVNLLGSIGITLSALSIFVVFWGNKSGLSALEPGIMKSSLALIAAAVAAMALLFIFLGAALYQAALISLTVGSFLVLIVMAVLAFRGRIAGSPQRAQ
jgi:hypothetical protein